MATERQKPPPDVPVRQGTSDDPKDPRELENPGDPGPTVLVPPEPPVLPKEPPSAW